MFSVRMLGVRRADGAEAYRSGVERFTDPDPEAVTVPAAALVLASGAAVALGVAPRMASATLGAEVLLPLVGVLGWGLVVWSALLGGGSAVHLLLSVRSRRPVLLREIALTLAALALVAAVVAANPVGGGSGAAG
ncbi:hypothetical protein SAMN06295885_3168 [Rathayibacter oskolensis]|uniref:Uncharacterized protein n=1 Tax=Rathayibacter oskolensis TaxID=1891671 RepID=A0A1X7PDY4_9MICO|nr:hypothetical protein SAMN06295885_3168 [Rathayibacter oskolensis]